MKQHRRTATDLTLLNTLKVTHVVNAAHGPTHINTGFAFYSHAHIQYHGVEAPDSRDFNLSMFFQTTADFIHTALSQDSGCPQQLFERFLVDSFRRGFFWDDGLQTDLLSLGIFVEINNLLLTSSETLYHEVQNIQWSV
ncbi:dual specificity protein phosphatase 13 [Silurus meridionalis]|uniref:Dual specificity protein phosphatase n=1 Tax=Silurus meridionalis TaxID=175797 RepID=A0A8T0BK11_SILME|nr:hypothetical protein HF521_021006 [Silurus meridionalis]KAI5103665.1 dual specificity protein phosphatase 13 [Silurus meridionalis]